ncbi:molecular chaperone, partial [Acinetobacter baumannii]
DAMTKLTWSIQQEQNSAYLSINNIGNRHALLNNLTLVDTTSNKSYPIKVNTVNGYILSGKSRNFNISSDFKFQADHKYNISLNIN